ncbi:MAG: HAD family phosphatase [Sedimentisphaerales bacterium]|nr:HAD family phosphatase [Sedimentisphaerales bacterium]
MQDIEAVLFDWGGVLIDNPASPLMHYCAGALGVPAEQYTRVHSRRGDAFQRGTISEELFWRQVCGDLGRPLPRAPSLWGQAFRAVYSPRDEVFTLAGRLRTKGYRTALLSNTEAPAMDFFLELRYEMFDVPIFSCAEGACKPEKKIYEISARKLGTPAGACVLIDDKPVFVDGARGAGMRGIVYESLAQVEQDLIALGVRM